MLGGRAEEGQDKGGAAVGGCVAEARESGSGSVVREWETFGNGNGGGMCQEQWGEVESWV